MSKTFTDAKEDFLECIYKLQKRDGVARTSNIVKKLGIVAGTVTNTVERLERDGLVIHQPYKGVQLTNKGQNIAIDIIRRHRLAERLLTDVLDIEWDESHKEACKIEHGFTGNIVKNLEKTLNYPKTCPHGNPVPLSNGTIIDNKSEPITNLNPREGGVIVKITQEETDQLRYLAKLGLKPGTHIEVLEKNQFEGSIKIRKGVEINTVERDISSTIWIKRS